MKLAISLEKFHSLYSHLQHQGVIVEGVQPVIIYNYDRSGQVRFLKAVDWHNNFHIAVNGLGGATAKE